VRSSDRQLNSTATPMVEDGQLTLPLPGGRTRPKRAVFTLDQVRALPDELAAIEMSIRCSGLMSKELYISLGIDKGYWSRIESGGAPFPLQKMQPFMDLVGNEIPLIYGVERRGYDWSSLRRHLDEKDALIERLERELEDERRLNRRILELKSTNRAQATDES
jgi:hypothetical protein